MIWAASIDRKTTEGAATRAERAAAALGASIRGSVLAQADRWPLWIPVAYGLGCAAYLTARAEPDAWFLVAAAGASAAVAAWAARRGVAHALLIALVLGAAVAAGGLVAKVRALRVDAPVVPSGAGMRVVEGWVVDVAGPGATGPRVVLAPVRISGLAPEETPRRVRVTLSRGEPPAPGTPVRVAAILNPSPGPSAPGAYDFARDAWFRSIGAVGYAPGAWRTTVLPEPPAGLRRTLAINAARWDLTRRIVSRLGPEAGGVAAAMVTGHEAYVDDATMDAMRDAGLAHVLSISGLHMAVVGGFVFFAVRLGLAAWPWAVLRAPGKKIAAVAGAAAVGAYLVISGAPPPAERAAVVAWAAFAAILVDRRAVSLNALALAAVVVLTLQPEAVLQPGFQMSFAATAALVALAEAWPRPVPVISAPWFVLALQKARDGLVVATIASLVAGAATGPFAVQHFNRIAVYGLFANLATGPVTTFVVMPALALGAALEPLGLGAAPLWIAGAGIEITAAVARFVAERPGAVGLISSAPAVALAVAFLGVLFLCLWKGPGRWTGLPFALAVLLWPRAPAPDVWVAPEGQAVAVVRDGEALSLRPAAAAFATDVWARRRGLTPPDDPEAALAKTFDCDRFSCAPKPGFRPRVAAWFGRKAPEAERLAELCASAEVMISRAPLNVSPPACSRTLVLDGRDLARTGALEIEVPPDAFAIWTAAEARGDRPWTRPSPAQ